MSARDAPVLSPLTTPAGRRVPADIAQRFVDSERATALLRLLQRTAAWEQLSTSQSDAASELTRLICWVGGADYDFYGATVHSTPWTPELSELREQVEAATGARFNSVLVNLYRDGADFIDWHADSESALGPAPTIASVSLGSERMFEMRHVASGDTTAVKLAHGSLVVMRGDAQRSWQHRVPAATTTVGPRINLTFRQYGQPG